MTPLVRALSAELLKLRRTLALWMCLIAPATVVVLLVLQMAFSRGPASQPAPEAAWLMFAHGVLGIWCFLMLPLFVTLQSALLAALEHGENQWKHLLSLPLPRHVHYVAKWVALVVLLLVAFVVLCLLVPIGGWALDLVQPGFGIAGPPPWRMLLRTSAAAYAASLLIVSLHTWIALRWRSFTIAIAVGMSATVCGFLIGQSERFGHWYPWSMPLQVMAGKGQHLELVVLVGVAGGLVVALLGLLDFGRRDVS